MGATITTFCNETNIVLYTSLSILFPYYWTNSLHPGHCVPYTVGRVWFTASAELSADTNVGNLYFPVSETEAAGLLYGIPWSLLDKIHFVNMTVEEAEIVMRSREDIIDPDPESVSMAYVKNQQKLAVQIVSFYANTNKKITIRGGPKGAVYKQHPVFSNRHIQIVSANFEPLTMTVS